MAAYRRRSPVQARARWCQNAARRCLFDGQDRHWPTPLPRRPTSRNCSSALNLTAAPRRVTDLNAGVLGGKAVAEVESFTFVSNDNKYEVEAFLTPAGSA